jgi:hypothetical protein
MTEKLIVGPIDRGYKTNRTQFNIDNDSFPKLINAYQWRGRVKRKRGTSYIGRLQVIDQLGTILSVKTDGTTAYNIADLLANPNINLRATFPNAQIVPGSLTITIQGSPNVFTDPNKNGILSDVVASGVSTINYSSGALSLNFTISVPVAASNVTIFFNYYPNLPVMGEEDFANTLNDFPGTIAFDTTNSYNIDTTFPYTITDTNYYMDPISIAPYVAKPITPTPALTPFHWNGKDYQQFWTTNYQGALWATNGIQTPFVGTGGTIGMQFSAITAVTYTNSPPILTITTNNNLVVGDFVYLNEIGGIIGVNWQTGFVTAATPTQITVQFQVTNPISPVFSGVYTSGGIVQYLTNTSNPNIDCIKYYNGSPTNGQTGTGFGFVNNFGWVNFTPPISQSPNGIGDLPPAIYYLVGCRMIVPFKDRLLFIGVVVQASSSTTVYYLQDTVVYSQNGTPYYTAQWVNSPGPPTVANPLVDLPTSASIIFNPAYTVPVNQTATAPAYFDDSTGFGGFATSGLDQPIITVSPNEDVLLLGYNPSYQQRFVYTGNDIFPFAFFTVNSELGSNSTFSAITMDKGVISRGPRGYVMSSQVDVDRVDLDVPDQVFEIALANNGNERFCAQRDFINEWIYFTYPGNNDSNIAVVYPDTTLLFNYRDNSWAIFYENYTTYGTFRPKTGLTWNTLPADRTWNNWDEPWNSGSTTLLQPQVIGGNQQGFILQKTNETAEATSLYIFNIVGNTITSPNHCLNLGDYIMISGVSGTIGSLVNGNVFSVFMVQQNSFQLNPSINTAGLTYFGNGLITRYYIPQIQTKQFPLGWSIGRKTRIGVQQYLLTTTVISQITLQIFLSQDSSNDWNSGPIVPAANVQNSSLVYSQILYTCPESINLGLTPYTQNLQQLNTSSTNPPNPTIGSNPQAQIWHRINTSLIGDTIQLGFTMSDAQMRDSTLQNQVAEIELHGFIIDVDPSQMLS